MTDAAWWAAPALPGWSPPGPERLAPFTPADTDTRWVLDFHTPRGVVPLAYGLYDDLLRGAAAAATELGLRGVLRARLHGCHVYLGVQPRGAAGDPSDEPDRAATRRRTPGVGCEPQQAVPELSPALAAYARGFREHWRGLATQLTAELDALDAVRLGEVDGADLRAHWRRARGAHARAWAVHFAVMYRVLMVHEHFLAACAAHGIDEVTATRMVEGEPSVIVDGDAAVRALAQCAVASGIDSVLLRTPTSRVLAELRRLPEAEPFLTELGRFQQAHGRRTGALLDLETPAWSEDPTGVLSLVRSALVAGPTRSWGAGEDATTLGERVLAGLSSGAAKEVGRAWEAARAVAASWWNEEHNHVIDLRAHLPVRDVAREVARRCGLDLWVVLHLLEEEFEALLADIDCGSGPRPGAAQAGWELPVPPEGVHARMAFTSDVRRGRRDLPACVGTGDAVDDVVFRHVLGGGDGLAEHLGADALAGHGVSPGVARGRVRVVRHAEDVVLLHPGDVLVCEATSPSWTPAFDRIAAAVCDGGGLLTHAAIISREYGVPCVCATVTGTSWLRDGDLVEVDGDAGVVRRLRRRG